MTGSKVIDGHNVPEYSVFLVTLNPFNMSGFRSAGTESKLIFYYIKSA